MDGPKNTNFNGEPLATFQNVTLNDCTTECINYKNPLDPNMVCAGIVTDFSYGNAPGACELKSTVAVPYFDEGRYSYYYIKGEPPDGMVKSNP